MLTRLFLLKLVFIVTLGQISAIFSQTLQPTEEKALLILTVTDMQDKPRPNEIIRIHGIESKIVSKHITNKEGKVEVLLPKGSRYQVEYLAFVEWTKSQTFEIPNQPGHLITRVNIGFDYEATRVQLKNVYFDTNKAILRPESYAQLNELAEVMKIRKNLKIIVEGHTDSVGNEKANQLLSQKRAEAVKNYLVAQKIDPSRIQAIGYGESRPVAENGTPEGRQKNRRTEVVVVEGFE
ncbi:MAG: OmpA family protein [Bacteroidia bacterium]|nr:OmpA family protein [Bacteroidia bacterium]MDW8158879.1 OmpA family protein [Bacteroidia bacterium]